jgi:RimJ/RimL family protein N-acetyltransferase
VTFYRLAFPSCADRLPAYSCLVNSRDTHIILETPRLILRQFTEGDVDNLFNLNSDPEVMRYLTGGRPTPREEIRDQILPFHLAVYGRLDRLGTWAAESTATGEFLGWFHFRPGPDADITNIDLGYRLRRPAWNKGYATEGSRAVIDLGFTELGVERVFAHTMTLNAASRHVLEKCGLRLVGTTPYDGPFEIEGAELGEVEYALTKVEWEDGQAPGGGR